MAILVNRAKMTTATTGTGTLTLGSAVSGYQSFADAGVTDADVVRYVIEDGSNWEIGEGTYTASGTTLSRTVLESSNADAAISLSGDATVFVTAVTEDIQQPPVEGAFVDGDKTKLDGIEALADVTDTANVTAAGALMDSEVTNLAQVKAFDSADYAVADGDVLDVTFTPTNYTPDATPAEAADVDDLAAHLQGIDTALGSAGGLVFITSSDLSSASVVEFTTVFDATKYDAYKFVLQNFIPSVDDDFIFMQMGAGGGWDNFVSDYKYVYLNVDNAGTLSGTADGGGNIPLINSVGSATGEGGASGTLEFYGPHLAQNTQIIANMSAVDTAGLARSQHTSGFQTEAKAIDRLRLFWANGNFESGTITVYGMVNA